MSEPVYTLSDLTARLGDASEDEVRLQLEGLGNAEFGALGRRIATPRLCKELARNYGRFADWLPNAAPRQLELTGFVTQDWLRVAVWTGRQAEIRYDAYKRGDSLGADDKELREVAATELRTRGRRARDRFRNSLLQLSGRVATWVARVEQAYSTSVTNEPAVDALQALAGLADEMLADTSPGMVARRQKSTLTSEVVAGYRGLAVELAAAAKAATAARKASAVSQQEVDVWDGMALTFFEQFVDAVEDAREEDPTIPAPSIIGLRGYFRRTGSSSSDAAEAEAPPPAG